MKFVKYHISIILPLFLLLFSIESFFVLKGIIDNYEKKLSSEYSIVVVSKVPLDKKSVENDTKYFVSLKLIGTDKMIKNLKNSIGEKNLQRLKNALPLFYSIKLNHLPTESELKRIKRKLLKYTGVEKVVTFKKSYSKFYNFLLFDKSILLYFTALVMVIVLLLIIKQAEVWIYEHRQRFEIMTILGAPFWMKSAMLYRVVIVDAVISSLLVSSVFVYLTHSSTFLSYMSNMGVEFPKFDILENSGILLGIGVIVSIISVTFAILQLNKEE
jgi:cell division transport system permease protein